MSYAKHAVTSPLLGILKENTVVESSGFQTWLPIKNHLRTSPKQTLPSPPGSDVLKEVNHVGAPESVLETHPSDVPGRDSIVQTFV